MTSGLARIDSLLARVIGTNAPRVVSVIGAGGSGTEEAAGALAVGLHESGRTVTRWRGRRLERDDEGSALADLLSRLPGDLDPLAARQGLAERIAPGGALVLQDAQWLDRSSVAALVGVADRADELDVTVVAFRRGWPRSQHLPALDEIAARTGDVVRWGPLDPAELRERLGHVGDHVAASEAAGVHAATAGLLWLVDALRRDAAPASVTLRVDSLEPTARALLLARTIGGVNPPVVEAATLATDLEGVVAAAEALVAEGLLTDRGGPPPPLVSQIVADSMGVSETAAVATALDAARGAAGLLGQDALTARRTLESGDDLSASSHAELVLHADTARPADREMATAVAVALLAARGLHERAAALAAGAATSADPPGRRLAAIAALEEVLAGGSPRPRSRHADGDGGLADQALMEAAAALDACSSGSPDQGLRLMSEVVSLVELRPPSLPWPDAPHALATLGALAAIDLPRAAQFAQRAVDGRAVSAAERRRMLLLAAWVDVRAGRLKRAVEAVRVESITECSPRDQLVIAAVEVAVARRSGDVAQLTECWTRAKPVLLAARPDLTNLAAIGELAAAATRLGAHEAARPVLETAAGLLESAGQPAFWALLFRWDEMQAAAAAGDNEGALALTETIAAMEVHLPAHRVVQEASAVWASLLDEAPDAARVTEAADALGGIGLAWEATFLVGQAAIRSTDSRMTRTLLGRAREMKGTVGAEPERLAADTGLSDRELEIALLVRDGLTHKEIGERLFISPKTVEHHVARIRQKLGATTRAEMLAAIALMAR